MQRSVKSNIDRITTQLEAHNTFAIEVNASPAAGGWAFLRSEVSST